MASRSQTRVGGFQKYNTKEVSTPTLSPTLLPWSRARRPLFSLAVARAKQTSMCATGHAILFNKNLKTISGPCPAHVAVSNCAERLCARSGSTAAKTTTTAPMCPSSRRYHSPPSRTPQNTVAAAIEDTSKATVGTLRGGSRAGLEEPSWKRVHQKYRQKGGRSQGESYHTK